MAKQKVILCAGAILSPALLLVSGIGNSSELREVGITPLCNVPSIDSTTSRKNSHGNSKRWDLVGKQLKDHFILPAAFVSSTQFWEKMNLCNGIRGWMALDIPIEKYENEADKKEDVKLSCPHVARCTLAFSDATSLPWILPQMAISPFYREFASIYCTFIMKKALLWVRTLISLVLQWTPLYFFVQYLIVGLMIQILNPESTGSVTLQKNDNSRSKDISFDDCSKSTDSSKTEFRPCISRISEFKIVVDPGYLTDDMDMKRIISCCKVFSTVSMSCFSNKCIQVIPGPFFRHLKTEKDVQCFARTFLIPYYHWNGTCAMKKIGSLPNNKGGGGSADKPLFVVGDDLKVDGIENLYVCDASVFPTNISSPTALTCAALGFAAGTFVWSA